MISLLGGALQQQGKHEEALQAFNKAIELEPNHPDFYNNRGIVQKIIGQPEAAVKSYAFAIQLKPDYPAAYSNLGNALMDLGQINQALSHYDKAIRLKPDYAAAYSNRGHALNNIGQTAQAIKCYEQSIQFKPDYAEAHHYLSTLKKYQVNDPQIKIMEQLLKSSASSPDTTMHLNFALGKAYADLQNYGQAFAYFQAGNQSKWKGINKKAKQDLNYLQQTKSAFPASTIEKFNGRGLTQASPVFIIGLPRSGKTLTETILSNHESVQGAGEIRFLQNILHRKISDSLNLQPMLDKLLDSSETDITKLAQLYMDQIHTLENSQGIVINTLPENFRYLGLIKLLFPKAKVIHCRRNPKDVCWAIYQKYFSTGYYFSYDLTKTGEFYLAYSDLMTHWHKILPGFIYDLHYEELVKGTPEILSQLFSFLDLEWDGNSLNQYENMPLHRNGIDSWKPYEDQIKPLLNVLPE